MLGGSWPPLPQTTGRDHRDVLLKCGSRLYSKTWGQRTCHWTNRSIWLRNDHSAAVVVCVWRYALLVVHTRKKLKIRIFPLGNDRLAATMTPGTKVQIFPYGWHQDLWGRGSKGARLKKYGRGQKKIVAIGTFSWEKLTYISFCGGGQCLCNISLMNGSMHYAHCIHRVSTLMQTVTHTMLLYII